MKALLAEKKGLEPLKHFQRLLASQAGLFSHPSIFPWVGFCFTKKEFDFIINYDFKYRMGDESVYVENEVKYFDRHANAAKSSKILIHSVAF